MYGTPLCGSELTQLLRQQLTRISQTDLSLKGIDGDCVALKQLASLLILSNGPLTTNGERYLGSKIQHEVDGSSPTTSGVSWFCSTISGGLQPLRDGLTSISIHQPKLPFWILTR